MIEKVARHHGIVKGGVHNSLIPTRVSLIIGPLLLAVFAAFGATTVTYHLTKTYSFGAAPGGREYFDYITVDPASRRVYLSHGTEVLVVNADTGSLEGKISGLELSHGVALVPGLDRGFITDGEQGKIVIFDLKTLKVIGGVAAAKDADSILYDPASKRVFSFNGDSRSSTVLDPVNREVVKTIELGGAPEFAVSDGRGRIYDNLEDKSESSRSTQQLDNQIALADRSGRRACATCHRPRSSAALHFREGPASARRSKCG